MAGKGHDEIEEEESVQELSPRSDQPNPCIKSCVKTNTDKKQRQVMVSWMSVSPCSWMEFIPEYWRNEWDVTAEPFSITYQRSWEVPADWKLANVIPVYKKGMGKIQETTDLVV